MRIVHTEASTGWGGQEMRILSEAQGMRARGHEVTLIASAETRIYREAVARGIPAVALPIGRKSIRGMLALRRWLKCHGADVVNTHSSTDSWLAAMACATFTGAPAMVRTRHISAPVQRDPLTRWLYRRATRRIVTTGQKLRQALIDENRIPEDRVVSVPSGIDLAHFSPGDSSVARAALGLEAHARHVGIVATLRSWKGHLYLLDAMRELAPHDCRLLIVGEGPMRPVIEARIRQLDIGERVILVGHQNDPAPYLRALDVFCLPSYANEGVPQALMQAMLTALPIVTTPVGSIPEAVEDQRTAIIVPPRDASALARAITRLLREPTFGAQLGAAARASALQRFSRDRMLDLMERVFRDAIAA